MRGTSKRKKKREAVVPGGGDGILNNFDIVVDKLGKDCLTQVLLIFFGIPTALRDDCHEKSQGYFFSKLGLFHRSSREP